ncbi:hypothetical protein R6Q59_021972 [Mikania micrantha]|uniref:Hydroxyproline-rich glycoprotein family protein n=1 Tax=Mikania micrantha TaxID=192012 RepID=A0A5N6MWG7_9ASTR|nr:hypothetical protein E3N88_26971 [Mikania micrantha]
MRSVNDSMVTINSAASAIQSSENRATQSSSVQKRRWGSCWNISWCFGSQKHSKRIGPAVLVPEPGYSTTLAQRPTNMSQPPSRVLPFIAPPSSPASFFHSEPPSATHSPGGFLSFNSVSASMYSPGGPANMFAIGPYAHETQLVSPPVFSTYTTEPSTAPFTPPPESVHLTTPSSPEVPYARLLGSCDQSNVIPYEFQSYQLYPGSPMGHLTPGSESGKVSPCHWESHHLVDHRVSFEVTPEQVVRCVERRRCADMANNHDDVAKGLECSNGEIFMRHQKHRSTSTLVSVKEFNFDSTDGPESDWWSSEKVLGKENGPIKNWSFFPLMQPSVS